MSVKNTLASHPLDTKELKPRCDNGSRYKSWAFMESMRALGIRVEFIYSNTPEQNWHVESFHKTLEREASLAARVPKLPGGRDGDSERVQRLQPGPRTLVIGVQDAL